VRVHQRCASSPTSRSATNTGHVLKYFGPTTARAYIVEDTSAPAATSIHDARLICVNDIYSFDPNAKVNLDDSSTSSAAISSSRRGPRLRQHVVVAHVAHADVADAVPVSTGRRSRVGWQSACSVSPRGKIARAFAHA